jgi:hypothetical protein
VVTDLPTIQEPGSPGTTWRMPAQWNRAQGAGQGLHERTRRVPNPGCGGNDVVLGDRYDAQLQALAWIVAQGAHVMARSGWNALRGKTRDGTPSVWEAAGTVPDGTHDPAGDVICMNDSKTASSVRCRVISCNYSSTP